MKLKRLIHSDDDISRLAEDLDVPTDVLERDYLLMAIAAELTMAFPTQICFKGGFVLRHSLGFDRLSGDIGATRSSPPKHKFAADEIKTAIQAAARRINFAINVPEPETDSASGLDFDSIAFTGLTANKGFVDVEISYREKLCRLPEDIEIGPPFYEPFKIPAMAPSEMMAEKVRALTQRLKHHDLADAGYMLLEHPDEFHDAEVKAIVPVKFELVRDGDPMTRITSNLNAMEAGYEAVIGAIATDYPSYAEARRAVEAKLAVYLDQV